MTGRDGPAEDSERRSGDAGVRVGVVRATVVTRLMTSLVYEVRPRDPAVFLAVAAGLMAVAFFASLIPSWRAARIHPAIALRYE